MEHAVITIERPAPGDYHAAFERYVARVTEADVLKALAQQVDDVRAVLGSIPAAREDFLYAPGKWTVRQAVGHIVDSERVFGYRILCVARGETANLPGFEENAYADNSTRERSPLASLIEEFTFLRRSHLLMLDGFDAAAWGRVGTANGNRITVRAMPYIMIGHVRHHLAVLKDKYGLPA